MYKKDLGDAYPSQYHLLTRAPTRIAIPCGKAFTASPAEAMSACFPSEGGATWMQRAY